MPMSKKQLRQWKAHMDAIIQDRDWEELFRLEDSGDFAMCLGSLIWTLAGPDNTPPKDHTQRVLFLCIQVEDCTQCDSLWNFFDDGFAPYAQETVEALRELGAPKSAAALERVLAALPEDGYPVENTPACQALSEGEFGKRLEEADHILCNYPDGPMHGLYFTYAKAHRGDFP